MVGAKGSRPSSVGRGNAYRAGKAPDRSPLAPKAIPHLPALTGVRLATAPAGIRYRRRDDLLLVTLEPGTQVAGVFTQSQIASAPVEWCRKHVKEGAARALVVNSGNANAFTGTSGAKAAAAVAQSASAEIGSRPNEVFLASTGVIGEPLPAEKITLVMNSLARSAKATTWRAAAEAIMTTDTYPKLATATARIGRSSVTINGIAKGSGMIAPDMATLLAFVFTDAAIPAGVLQSLLSAGARQSFNCITVDSDTSTSDTLLLFATGKGPQHPAVHTPHDKHLADFREKLDGVLLDLALQVVRDGEGAQKLIRVDVVGAKSDESARRIALSIANSPLVKTAIAGGDANWGRVVMAIGKAGEPADRDRLSIWLGGRRVAENGASAAAYDEAAAAKAVSGREVLIKVDLKLGQGKARIYTCDLTHGYIRINGSYRS
ncbi:MAG: bifunctional glutamate N-acetyltransferase/amino-acid acetyltransferase ArgJ [Alphaproteobacteria bacterium]|jgi:glutamate N-acetyltransferase/amino-acid N-acetyltransferase